MYLEFKDVIANRLFFVSKAFYHNIIEDNELMRRMLMLYLGVINDSQNEEEYQYFVNQLISKANGEEEEEAKCNFTWVYEKPAKELALLFNRYSRKFSTKQMVCAFRTTGGYEDDIEDIIQIFTHDRHAYWSDEIRKIKHLPISVTGIAWEEDSFDYLNAKELLRNAINWSNKLNIELNHSFIDIEKSEFNLGEAIAFDLDEEDLSWQEPKLLNYWLRNRLIHLPIFNVVKDEKDGIVELDITLHQILSRNTLFSWNYFKVGKLKFYSCPSVAFAIFVHDYPIWTENHPIPSLIEKLWEKSEWNLSKFKELFKNGFQNLIPKICNSNEYLIEFNQDFYHKIFDSKRFHDYDQLKSNVVDSLSQQENNKILIPMFNELKSVYDIYRLRLQ